jgi:hypothetical protein
MVSTTMSGRFFVPAPVGDSATGRAGDGASGSIGSQGEARVLVQAAAAAEWMAAPNVIVRRHPTGGWTHAVKQSAPGSRVYRGWWPCRRAAAQAVGAV